MTDRPVQRTTARVVVLDPAGRVVLLGARLPDPSVPPGEVLFWYTPGGGVEDGETLRGAGVRELAEEIGLVVDPAALEGPVWLRRHVGAFGDQVYDTRETFFVLRDVVHEVVPGALTELEVLADEPHRWWSAEEIAASAEVFVPGDLPALLAELQGGPWTGPPRVVG
ncbi:NUDIX hydrolase [Blastococcus saxobsidens]|uniref:8-oxo-dGTP pyrophosphatase MutT (NUDIX family) n=1 Tax=Blastococcus saxobsidens TaxID=138336 RepID=A0A4Q7Y817_9ACTN|nr:NUDIX domain-containing protein [Blastococcus saxobsidens]RZU32724.1 8-oxo-dGTP pyrophosphatase MutT (NUDIX family) [Blastococcus saxobsidens]